MKIDTLELRAAIAPFVWSTGDEDAVLMALLPVVKTLCRLAALDAVQSAIRDVRCTMDYLVLDGIRDELRKAR